MGFYCNGAEPLDSIIRARYFLVTLHYCGLTVDYTGFIFKRVLDVTELRAEQMQLSPELQNQCNQILWQNTLVLPAQKPSKT